MHRGTVVLTTVSDGEVRGSFDGTNEDANKEDTVRNRRRCDIAGPYDRSGGRRRRNRSPNGRERRRAGPPVVPATRWKNGAEVISFVDNLPQ